MDKGSGRPLPTDVAIIFSKGKLRFFTVKNSGLPLVSLYRKKFVIQSFFKKLCKLGGKLIFFCKKMQTDAKPLGIVLPNDIFNSDPFLRAVL